jgi:hypothetical protein
MHRKKQLQVYIYIAIILTIAPLLLYGFLFWKSDFSRDIEVWGNFANYFSGFTTPILSIFNLLVLVRLTLSISDYDNDRMLTQLRYDAYKEITKKLNGLNKENYTLEGVNNVYYFLENYSLNNFFLLDGDNYKIQTIIHLKLWKILCVIKITLEEYENRYDEDTLYNTPEYIEKLKEKLTNRFIEFDVTKLELLSFLEKMILGRPIENFKKHFLTEQNSIGQT